MTAAELIIHHYDELQEYYDTYIADQYYLDVDMDDVGFSMADWLDTLTLQEIKEILELD